MIRNTSNKSKVDSAGFLKTEIDGSIRVQFIYLLAAGFAFRVLLAFVFPGHPIDMNCFKAWALSAANDLTGFYSSGQLADYPPLYIYVLFFLGKVAGTLSLPYDSTAFNTLVKLPSIIADLVISILLFIAVRGKKEQNTGIGNKGFLGLDIGILSALMFLLNPVSILNSAVWGQVDSVFTLFIILMFLYIDTKLEASAVFITLAVLMKPQGLIFVPVILAEFVRKKDIQVFIKSAGYSILTAFLMVLPFSLKQGPFWIFSLYTRTAGEYKYASLNAFNLFMLAGANWKNDSEPFLIFSYINWGYFFIACLLGFTAYLYWKSINKDLTAIFCGIFLVSGTFLLSSRMHERYMFPAIALLAAAYGLSKDRRLIAVLAGFSVTNFFNTLVVLADAQKKVYWIPANDFMGRLVSLINIILFAYMIKVFIDILLKNKVIMQSSGSANQIAQKRAEQNLAGKKQTAAAGQASYNKLSNISTYKPIRLDKQDFLIMAAITLVYFGISIFNLGSFKIPQTSWRPASAGDSFIVQFDREYDLSRVYYYNGYGDAKFKLEYRTPNGTFVPLADIDKTYLDFYTWRFAKVQAKTSQVRVTAESYVLFNTEVQQQSPAGDHLYTEGPLLEMAFIENGASKPIESIKVISKDSNSAYAGRSAENLFDEQEGFEYAPSNMTGTIFDEIYHVRTAYEFLNRLTPYENTHPPLGKAIISLGIILFGMNPFGWRIMGVLFGTAVIPMIYLFGRKLFGNKLYGFLSAFLMMLDFMNLVQARIGTVDVYVVLFILIMYYFMYDSFAENPDSMPFTKALLPLFLSGLFFGIGAAAKWISIYAGAGLALLYFWSRWNEYSAAGTGPEPEKDKRQALQRIIKLSIWCIVFFILIPAGIYYLSYIPFFGGRGYTFKDVWANQVGMFSYHSGLQATHSFGSAPWSWPFMVKPVWFYTNAEDAFAVKTVSTIVTMGNPAIWWIGIICVPAAAVIAWKKKDRYFAPILVGLAFQYLPWFFVSRLMFIYHFYSSVPFVIFSIVYVIKYIMEKCPEKKSWVYGYLAFTAVLFIMFYPVLTGLQVSRDYIENYLRWFKTTWYF